jgi:tetratricopeptide (TPR) repeat protein
MASKAANKRHDGWLGEAYPEVHYTLLAVEGDGEALAWLEANSKGLWLFARAHTGDRKALQSLQDGEVRELDDLFEIIDNDDLTRWLEERHPEFHELFQAVQGDEAALKRLKRKKAAPGKLGEAMRQLHEKYLHRSREERVREDFDGGAAADMRCLVGEMHLSNGEYHKAIEAFTRALESNPTADVYEGRAQAYRALAEADERKARELR